MKPLVLASASPRRRELLDSLGVKFRLVQSRFQEPGHAPGQAPEEYVIENARGKALDVAGGLDRGLVIGADTVVVFKRAVLGKPGSVEEAARVLRLLSGQTHAVYTGLCLSDAETGAAAAAFEKTSVTFRNLTDRERRQYLERIDPLDKAGAYAVQGAGAVIVAGIRGCYYNVVGFPIARLEQMLLGMGLSLFGYMEKRTEQKRTGC